MRLTAKRESDDVERIGFDLVAIEMLLAGGVILLAASLLFIIGIAWIVTRG